MATGATINQESKLGLEATPGAGGTVTKRLLGYSIELSPELDIQEFTARGVKFATQHALTREWCEGTLEGGMSFNEAQYVLAGAMAKVTPTTYQAGAFFVAGSTYTVGTYVRPNTPNGHIYVVTVATGAAGGAEPTWPTTAGATVVSGGVTFKEAGADASGAQRYAFAIDDVGKDDIQTYVIEQADRQRARARKALYCHFNGFSISTERAGEMEMSADIIGRKLAETTVTTAGITEAQFIPGSPEMVNVYMDSLASALGTTKLANINYELELSDRFNQAWFHDREIGSFLEHVETQASLELTMLIGEGPELDSLVDGLRKGQRKFVRLDILGPEISPGANYRFQLDTAVQVSDSYSFEDEDGVYAAEITLAAERDPTWGKTVAGTLVNKTAA